MPSLSSHTADYYSIPVDGAAPPAAGFPFHPRRFAACLVASTLVALGLVGLDAAYPTTTLAVTSRSSPRIAQPHIVPRVQASVINEKGSAAPPKDLWTPAAVAATTTVANLVGPVDSAVAGELAKGRTFALLHPAAMFGLLALSLWAAYLGFQWKRTRTIGSEITEVKAQATEQGKRLAGVELKETAAATLAALRAAGKPATGETLAGLEALAALEQRVEGLQAERKTLTAGNFRDKHFNAGSLLLAVGVSSAIIGPVNTFIRTGKLFPGPHLYVGAVMTALWAIAAGTVPAMTKGNEVARTVHITANGLNIALFIWQVGTGIEIIYKVLEFTTFP